MRTFVTLLLTICAASESCVDKTLAVDAIKGLPIKASDSSARESTKNVCHA